MPQVRKVTINRRFQLIQTTMRQISISVHLYIKLKKFTEARALYENILEFKKDDAETYYQLGLIAEGQSQTPDAIKYYLQAISNNRKYIKGYINLGKLYASQNMAENAEEAYKNALEIDPSSYDAGINLANLYYREKKFSDARSLYEKALMKNPDNIDGRMAYAISQEESGSFDQAQCTVSGSPEKKSVA